MGLLTSLRISASALMAQRLRMDVIANNVANMNTSRTADGTPYRRQSVVFGEQGRGGEFRDFLGQARGAGSGGGGVPVRATAAVTAPPRRAPDATPPHAPPGASAARPHIDIVVELTDLITANRAYQASVTVLTAAKALALGALGIGRQ